MLFEQPPLNETEQAVIEGIDELRKRLRYQLLEPTRWFGSLRRLSFARAVQGSNSIEGYNAKLDDVAASVAGEDPLDTDLETRLALSGYRDAMTYVIQLANEPDFSHSAQLLKSLHFMMTGYKLSNRPGLWRLGQIFVHNEETDAIVYEGPDVDLVQGLIEEFVAKLNGPDSAPPTVRAAMAHLNLVMIHPFRDGNGRMARCLQTLMLAREGVLSPQFCSIEEYLGRNTQRYYDVLVEVGGGSWHPERDARPWLRFTLTAHLRQAETLLFRVKESEQLWVVLEKMTIDHGLPERVIPAMFDAAQGLRVRRSTYRAMHEEGLSEQTAGRDLRQLAQRGLFVPHGEARGRFYRAGSELREIWKAIHSTRPRKDGDPFDSLPK